MSFDISLWQQIITEQKNQQELYRQEQFTAVKKLLKEYFAKKSVEKVYLIGSLTKPDQYNKYSDIDIAIKGMNPQEYLQIFGELEELLNTENIDLIEIEKCGFAEIIETEGVVIK
jgi:predicted nucleotidyltransferase